MAKNTNTTVFQWLTKTYLLRVYHSPFSCSQTPKANMTFKHPLFALCRQPASHEEGGSVNLIYRGASAAHRGLLERCLERRG